MSGEMATVQLKDVCKFENGDRGKNYPGRKALVESGVPFINAGHLTDGKVETDNMDFIPRERFNLLRSGKVRKGDILFCLRGSLGKFGVVEDWEEGAIASSLVIVRPKKNIDQRYLAAYFGSDLCQFMIQQFKNGLAQPNLSVKSLKQFEIPLPELGEQRRIAAVLDKADALRQKRRAALAKLDTLLQATFLHMFGDPVTNPMGWEVVELGHLGDGKAGIVDGPFGSAINVKKDYVDYGEIPVIRTKNVSDFQFVTDDLKFITREKFETVKRSEVLPGDVILTKVGTIGNLCIFPESFERAILSTTGSCRIRVNSQKISNSYLLHYLHNYKPEMMRIASTGVQAFLNMKHIKSFKVPLPGLKLQRIFEEKEKEISKHLQIHRNSLIRLDNLFHALQQRAFNGQL